MCVGVGVGVSAVLDHLHRMVIISLIMKPLTIALACIAAYFRSGASVPSFNLGEPRACSSLISSLSLPASLQVDEGPTQ